ncbi:MAG: o-succinylbenzoate synthase [Prevotella sp.]|nr:o-succinylbenzoate synthase [Prevotella sp.]
MKITITPRTFHFRQPAGTSRGVYTERKSWMIELTDGQHTGIGECAPLPGLSCDDIPEYEKTLRVLCDKFEQEGQIDYNVMRPYPSILFGLETALSSLNAQRSSLLRSSGVQECRSEDNSFLSKERAGGEAFPLGEAMRGLILFNNAFTRGERGIPINGLVWMGSYEEMMKRIDEKIGQGYRCIKLKIGAIDFEQELDMVRSIRERFSAKELQIRLDANGGFSFDEALYKLELLSQYSIHSIEQPIKAKQWAFMAELCRESPLPIALDEELIGVNMPEMKRHVLNIIKPAHIVLKPSLHGGMQGCREWIDIARDMGIGSWITSALESNIGLNAIAQFTADVYGDNITMPQGLGTGQLFTDNIDLPLEIRDNALWISRNS